ncbi:hypothetical protein Ais01nite_55170 [Asanoa ishikariensis]|nr:hypothetical protein Ais01nite_55170 [Asanoa ishikariensis]
MTFCRYSYAKPVSPLRTVEHSTAGGQRFRAAINAAPSDGKSCPVRTDYLALDVVRVADRASVAPVEFRYLRGPSCGYGDHVAPAVLAAIDEVLGPV